MSIPEEKREEAFKLIQNAHCLDISDAYLSGGTNPDKDIMEGKLILTFEKCEKFASDPAT